MIRSKYFYMKKIYNEDGKYIGIVEDLVLDFFIGEVIGFKVSNTSIFSKKNFVSTKNIISMGENIIISKMENFTGLNFKSIKGIEIINLQDQMLGVLEDLIIEKATYFIKGIIVSTGIIEKIINGKKVILVEDCILGERSIVYVGNKKITLKILPKGLGEKKLC